MSTPARFPLGRRVDVQHDPRSLHYAHHVLPRSAIKSQQWARRVPVFDQGQVGSCTGNAAAGVIGTDSATRPGYTTITITAGQAAATAGLFTAGTVTVDEHLALACYSLNTRLDAYPGDYPGQDTGSDGLAAAKTLEAIGQCDSYTHGFTMDALDTALQTGPVMAGIQWMNSMFNAGSDGRIPVDKASGVAGGHEFVIDGLDVTAGRYWMTNSWGTGWGVSGRGWFTRADLAWLLSQQGDVTVPHLTGGAGPTPPAPPPVDPAVQAFYDAVLPWAKAKHVGVNKTAAQAALSLFNAEGLST